MLVGRCRLCLTQDYSCAIATSCRRASISLHGMSPARIQTRFSSTRRCRSSAPEQATAYLLCGECEERFNSGGETWVLKNCWHSEVDFQLRSNLVAIPPSPLSTPGFTIWRASLRGD